MSICFGEQNGLTLILTYVYLFIICCMFAFNFKKKSPIYEFSFLQYDNHLLHIMPALRFHTTRLSALKMWTCWDRWGFRGFTTRSDGIRKKCWHFCHPIIPSSHHLIPSSLVPSSHHPKHVSKSSSHLALGLVDWRRYRMPMVWVLKEKSLETQSLKDTWWRGQPPMNISHGETGYLTICKGCPTTPILRGRKLTMDINHLQVMGWSSKQMPKQQQDTLDIPPKITYFLLHMLLREILVVIT